MLAQRLGRVFAAPATWCRLIRIHGWRRPRTRVHPSKPKKGIRAARPDEIWHVDTSVLRLLDATKVYLHAVIDNYSRKILAWCVATKFDVMNTVNILREAANQAVSATSTPKLLVDGGSENLNTHVDELIGEGLLSRVIALKDIPVLELSHRNPVAHHETSVALSSFIEYSYHRYSSGRFLCARLQR